MLAVLGPLALPWAFGNWLVRFCRDGSWDLAWGRMDSAAEVGGGPLFTLVSFRKVLQFVCFFYCFLFGHARGMCGSSLPGHPTRATAMTTPEPWPREPPGNSSFAVFKEEGFTLVRFVQFIPKYSMLFGCHRR